MALEGLVFTAMGLPPVVVGLAVYLLLSRSGPLGSLGYSCCLTPRAMVLAQAILVLPLVTGLTAAAVAAVPAELFVQIVGLGASRRQARPALLREVRPEVLAAIAAGFDRSISEVGAVLIVGGNIAGWTRVLTTAIVMETVLHLARAAAPQSVLALDDQAEGPGALLLRQRTDRVSHATPSGWAEPGDEDRGGLILLPPALRRPERVRPAA